MSCFPTRPASSRPCSVLDPPGTLETSPHDVERPCGAAFTGRLVLSPCNLSPGVLGYHPPAETFRSILPSVGRKLEA